MDSARTRRRSLNSDYRDFTLDSNRNKELSKKSSLEISEKPLPHFSQNKILNALVLSNTKKDEKLKQLQKEHRELLELNKPCKNKKMGSSSPTKKLAKAQQDVQIALIEHDELKKVKDRLKYTLNIMKERLEFSLKMHEKHKIAHKNSKIYKDRATLNLCKTESQLKVFQKSENARRIEQKTRYQFKLQEFRSQNEIIERNKQNILKLESEILSSRANNKEQIKELDKQLRTCREYQHKRLQCEEEINFINKRTQKIIETQPLRANELDKLISIFNSYKGDKYNLRNLYLQKLNELTEKQNTHRELLKEKENLHLESNSADKSSIRSETKLRRKPDESGFTILMHFQSIFEKINKLFNKVEKVSEIKKSQGFSDRRSLRRLNTLSPSRKNIPSYNFVDYFRNKEETNLQFVESHHGLRQQFAQTLLKMTKIIKKIQKNQNAHKLELDILDLNDQYKNLHSRKTSNRCSRRSNTCFNIQQDILPKISTDIPDLVGTNRELIQCHRRLFSMDVKAKHINQPR